MRLAWQLRMLFEDELVARPEPLNIITILCDVCIWTSNTDVNRIRNHRNVTNDVEDKEDQQRAASVCK